MQIAYLNKTVKDLRESAKSPKSVGSISKDIEQLKKGMADTGQEITAVRDTVTKLRKLAHLQNKIIKSLQRRFFNLSVSVYWFAFQKVKLTYNLKMGCYPSVYVETI